MVPQRKIIPRCRFLANLRTSRAGRASSEGCRVIHSVSLVEACGTSHELPTPFYHHYLLPRIATSPVRAKFNRELTASLEDLKQIDYLQMEKGTDPNPTELWRISLRVAALSDVDYGNFIYTLREAVQPVLHAYETRRALLTDLAAQDLSGAGRVNPKSRVLRRSQIPSRSGQADLLTEEDEIDARAAYLSTLGELIMVKGLQGHHGWMSQKKNAMN